ncbi:MAP3K7 C-terminal-like protein isoform X2 [Anolis carolinensis]|uniref:MAP3K7 C-terminal-like protein isoform X2 n=1 Tax=Anolis carolinensis TaxID=28377 RepID=UPI00046268EA|nr:PREDICTED: MAP3K7 C-terminal-like protein isoform X2 [Anolis carolinensis]|eukprot:XP_008105830.1 PREDICTED: MAP3K7 C-terminal-like protein isoform X2 [Anolis carolinensis]
MITTARIAADKAIRIAFSLNDSPDDTPPENAFPLAFPDLEQQLQPLPPCHDSEESMQVFKQHCQIAEEYYEVKKEIALLEERKHGLDGLFQLIPSKLKFPGPHIALKFPRNESGDVSEIYLQKGADH